MNETGMCVFKERFLLKMAVCRRLLLATLLFINRTRRYMDGAKKKILDQTTLAKKVRKRRIKFV